MNLTDYYKYRVLFGSGGSSGGGGSNDDVGVTIYDGEIEVSLDYDVYLGAFTPTNEIGIGSIDIELNGVKYKTDPAEGDSAEMWWQAMVNDSYVGVVLHIETHVYEVFITSDLLLSDDDPQTVTIKIAQEQSNVTIFDGTIETEVTYNGEVEPPEPEYWAGGFTPDIEPSDEALAISFNGHTYITRPRDGDYWDCYTGLTYKIGVGINYSSGEYNNSTDNKYHQH